MTDHIDISELKEYLGKEIQGFYLVAEKELRDGRNDQYLRLRLQDRSGTIAGNVWKDAKNISESFSVGDVVHVKALVNSYKEQIQLNVSQIRFADHSEYRLEDFVTRSKKDPDTLAEQFFAFVDKVENIWLHKLLQAVFGDKEIFSRFLEAPAAKSWHHN